MKAVITGASILTLGLSLLAMPAAAQQIGANSGVTTIDAHDVEGPKTIAAKNSFTSPLPFFKDLKPWDPNYKVPRTAYGRPDFDGVWSSASLTAMTRTDRGAKLGVDTLVIPPEKIAQLTNNASYSRSAADSQKRTDPNAGVFTDKNVDAGYNA
jgi:hypothetical protein